MRAAGAEVIYSDTFKGTKAHRPELDKLVMTKLDRIARNAVQGKGFLKEKFQIIRIPSYYLPLCILKMIKPESGDVIFY